VLREATRLYEARLPFALCTVVRTSGSTPRKAGAKMLVRADGSLCGSIGGGRVEHEVTGEAMRALEAGAPRVFRAHLVRDLAMCCGGEMEIMIDPMGKAERVVICGAGHISRALAPLCVQVGFDVLVCDEAEEAATRARFAEPVRLADTFDPREWGVPLDGATSVVIVTRDHAVDQQLLEALYDRDLAYLGCVGSRGKLARFRKRLEHKLADPARLARVRGPVGVDIGAQTPEEIAVSIVAELIGERAARRKAAQAAPPEVGP
jgi:xanthine dehydrogenase accessory factor